MAVQPPDPPDPTVAQPKSYASLFTKSVPPPLPSASSPLEYFKGYPAVSFTEDEIEVLAKPYKSALVGKFEGFRPPLQELRRRMDTIGFKGTYTLGLLDPKHVLIQFVQELDYQRCWLKRSWNLGSSVMKVIPWTPTWSPEAESPIAPVWVELVGLPIHFFEKSSLQRITRHLGTLIKVDAATEKRSRPSVAKVSIAMNLLQTPPDRIWIGIGHDDGFWQSVSYLDRPDYCTRCSKIGHSISVCGRSCGKENSSNNPRIKTLSVWRELSRQQGLGKDKNQVSTKQGLFSGSDAAAGESREVENESAHAMLDKMPEIYLDRLVEEENLDDPDAPHEAGTDKPNAGKIVQIFSSLPPQNQEKKNHEQEIPAAIQDDIEEINEEYQTGQPSFPYPEEQNSERIQEHAKNGVSPTHTTVQNQMQVEERCSTPIQLSPIKETNNNGTEVEERSSTVQPSPMLPSQIKETNHNGTGPPCETMTSHMEERSSHMKERSSTCSPVLTSQNQETNSNGTDHNQTAHHGRDHAPNQPLTIQDHPQPNFSSGPAPTFSMQDKIQKETDLLKASKDIHHLMGPNEGMGGMVFLRNLEPNKGTQVTENKVQENTHLTAEELASPTEKETNTVTVAGMRTVAAHAGTVAHADTVAGNEDCSNYCSNNLTIPHVQVQFMDAIDNHIASERAQEIQMEALDLAEPRQKITKGHMELRKLDINVTRIDELLQMDSIGTGVASRLRSKDDHSLVDSIAKIQSNQTPQSEDTDEDTEELSYMDERAAQWEVNIGSSRRRALQTRRKANKIAAKGNTLINKGKYHAYEVKRRGGSKI